MTVHRVHHVDPAIAQEVRVQSETQETMVTPVAHLLADVDQGVRKPYAIGDDPNLAPLLPYILPSIPIPCNAYGLVECAASQRGLTEVREKGLRFEVLTDQTEQQNAKKAADQE